MSIQTYLNDVDRQVAAMFREDYRTVLFTYDHSATPLTGLVADFLAFITVVDDDTILELTDQYIATWTGNFDPNADLTFTGTDTSTGATFTFTYSENDWV